jgi:AraC-like DNA-binding protein
VPASKIPSLLAFLEGTGIDGRKFLVAWGIELGAPDTHIPLDLWVDINRRAADLLDDPNFGIHYGERFKGMPTLLGHLLSACSSPGEALAKYLSYQELEHHAWHWKESRYGDSVELTYCPSCPAALERTVIDFSLSSLVGAYRRLTGRPLVLRSAHFTYATPSNTEEHRRLFGRSLHFSSDRNAIVFGAKSLELSVEGSSPSVREHLERPLHRALLGLTTRAPMSMRVANVLGKGPNPGTRGLREVAKELGLGARRLQMLLKAEGSTFQRVCASIREEMARQALADPNLTIQEVSFVLGFSEPSAFHRAFRRWTGLTPAQVRSSTDFAHLPSQPRHE